MPGQPKAVSPRPAKAAGRNCSIRYLNTVIRLLTMTNRPPSRTHLAAAGCLSAKLFQNFIVSSLYQALFQAVLRLAVAGHQPFAAFFSALAMRERLRQPRHTCPRPLKKWPLTITRIPSAISMLTMPFIILAMPRKGML